ncbi:MAG: signal peptidase I [Dehalococcoidia bacterium]|nr:signal peptidase I [Dehalococcoidia bacterium]
MNEDGQVEDEEPSWEAEAEQESPPETLYDPLIDPWNDPASASVIEYRLSQQETRPPLRAGPPQPYARADEFTELRRRLRQETVVVPRRPRIWAVTIRELAETLLLAVLIFLAVRASMQNFRVEGQSMQPSLDNGEYLIVNKLTYSQIDLSIFDWIPFFDSGANPVHHLWATPDRGDVIVFRAPTSPDRDFIKRIIGVPGDVVEVEGTTGTVMVNGESLDEPYIKGKTTCQSACGPWQVPERSYFVMGDNRQNSSDSRQGWFVPEENIIGKALITYWHDGSPELDLAPNHKVSFISEAAAEE